jgi:putative heme transporter
VSGQNALTAVTETPSASAPRPLWKRWLQVALVVAALAVVFGWVLPRLIDYEQVWDALTELDVWEALVLLGLGLARVVSETLMYRAFLPGLTLRRGTEAYLSSNLAGQVLPPPAASVVQYAYFRGAGYAAEPAGIAALGSFVFPMLGRLLLPCVALVALLITGETNGLVLIAASVSFALAVACGVAAFYLFRADGAARWIGERLQRPLSWVLVKLKRDPIDDVAGRAARFRGDSLTMLRRGWLVGSLGVAANLSLTYLILLAALRFVGASGSDLSAASAFGAFALAFWAGAVFPITGSGLGVVDAVLIAVLIDVSNAPDDVLVAAAVLWRVFYSVVALPPGAVTLSRFQKTNPEVLERRSVRIE